jgi:hypothetical protein
LYSISLIVRLVGTIALRGKTFKTGQHILHLEAGHFAVELEAVAACHPQHLIATKKVK